MPNPNFHMDINKSLHCHSFARTKIEKELFVFFYPDNNTVVRCIDENRFYIDICTSDYLKFSGNFLQFGLSYKKTTLYDLIKLCKNMNISYFHYKWIDELGLGSRYIFLKDFAILKELL